MPVKSAIRFAPIQRFTGLEAKTARRDVHTTSKAKKCGSVVLFDYAGQREFYASHAAVLWKVINPRFST